MSAIRMSAARTSCTLKQVSSTSDEVMPECTKRASGPTISDRCVRKAMTSCLTSRLDRVDARDVEFGGFAFFPDFLRRLLRDDAEFGHGVGGVRLDLEPDAELRLRRPDRGHVGAGIARDHAASPRASAAALRIAAMLAL